MQHPDLTSVIRELVKQKMEEPPNLSLTQIANLCDTNYYRLRRFIKNYSDTLLLDEAQRLYEKLSGKRLKLHTNDL